MLPRRVLTAAALLLPLVLILSGCSGDPQDTLTKEGDVSHRITDLFFTTFWVAVAVFILVQGAIIFLMIRFRRRPGDTQLPKQTHGSTPLELTWTIIPAVILAVLAIPTVRDIRFLSDTPDNALQITVNAQQWWWGFEYPSENVTTADTMVIPVGRPVEVTLHSKDVIHSFWVPHLAGKTDVVPNHSNKMWFNAKEPGTYSGQCAEFCALSHAKMKFQVVAMPEAEFAQWVQQQTAPAAAPTTAQAREGQQLFFGLPCISCHTVTGQTVDGKQAIGTVGPNLTHFASRSRFAGAWLENTPEDLREWLRDPPAIKPGSKMPNYNLTEDQITLLIAYLESLK